MPSFSEGSVTESSWKLLQSFLKSNGVFLLALDNYLEGSWRVKSNTDFKSLDCKINITSNLHAYLCCSVQCPCFSHQKLWEVFLEPHSCTPFSDWCAVHMKENSAFTWWKQFRRNEWERLLLTESYRDTEWLRLKGTSGGHLVQLPAQGGPPRLLPRTMSKWLLGNPKEVDSTTCLGDLCQGLVMCRVK